MNTLPDNTTDEQAAEWYRKDELESLTKRYTRRTILRTQILAEMLDGTAEKIDLASIIRTDCLTGAITREVGLFHLKPGHTVAMIDLDGFKAINDTLGHQAGDEVLRAVTGRLMPLGAAIRMGGDEFLLMSFSFIDDLPGMIRRVISAPILTSASPVPVTVGASVGIATWDGEDASTVDELLAQADKRMYEIKRAGGGRRAARESWCNHDPRAVVDGVCECGEWVKCRACVDHPGWGTGDLSLRREPTDVCRACLGSATNLTAFPEGIV